MTRTITMYKLMNGGLALHNASIAKELRKGNIDFCFDVKVVFDISDVFAGCGPERIEISNSSVDVQEVYDFFVNLYAKRHPEGASNVVGGNDE